MDENSTKSLGFENTAYVISNGDFEHGIPKRRKSSTKTNKPVEERPNWGNGLEFLMSCIAMSVGLGNIWRFPFIANQNGGGAFLIPYLIVLTLIGRPLYYMEMSLGQFSSRGCAKMYEKLSPVFKGIGIAQVFGSACVASYYCSLMAITFFYLINSFTNDFPWAICQSSWEPYALLRNLTCVDKYTNTTPENNTISSSELYFKREVLKEADDISGGIGPPEWRLTLMLLLSWFITFLVSIRGVKSSGKASYFLAIFPYIIMFTLLIRASTLEGAADGMFYFIETDFSRLLDADVWYAAVTQCFFSLNVGFGNIITLASYNQFHHNINRDALVVTTLDTFTSLLSGVTIFGILGNLAYEMNIPPSRVIASGGGTDLAFISYPSALSKFTFAPWLFAIAFFFMLFVLGIGSLSALHANFNTLLKDSFTEIPDWLISALTATSLFLIGLIYITPGGQYTLELVDHFGGTFVIFTCVILEVMVVCWWYGIDNLCQDVEFMTKKKVNFYWRFCWGFAVPVMLSIIYLYFIATLTPMKYGIDDLYYPIELNVLGWGILGVAVVQIIFWVIYYLYANRNYPGKEMFRRTFSTKTWAPNDPNTAEEWRKFKKDKLLQRDPPSGSLIIRKLKLLIRE